MNHIADFSEMVAHEFSLETFRIKRDMHRLQAFEDALPKLLARLNDLRPICARLWAKRENALKHHATRHDAKLVDEELRQPAAEYYELIAQVNLIQAELPALRERVAAYAGDNTDNG